MKQFGPEPGPSASESLGIGLLRNEGFWMGNYVGGGAAALLAHADWPRKGLDPRAFKKQTLDTHTPLPRTAIYLHRVI